MTIEQFNTGRTAAELKNECYCRQEELWRRQNPGKCLSAEIAEDNKCSATRIDPENRSNVIQINKGCGPGETSTDWVTYTNDVEKHCKDCSDDSAYDSKDCTIPEYTNNKFEPIYEQLRKQNNMLNKFAQMGIYNWERQTDLNETVLQNINDNLDKNINIGNINLINKQKELYTKKRLLLYDEQNDRIYRVFILILKSILLIMSIIVIKLLSN